MRDLTNCNRVGPKAAANGKARHRPRQSADRDAFMKAPHALQGPAVAAVSACKVLQEILFPHTGLSQSN